MDEAPWNASIKDADGRYLYLNRHYLATLGARFGSEWYGKTDGDIWPPENAARMREIDTLALAGADVPVFSLVRPFDDGPHTFVIMKFPLPTEDGRTVIGGVGLDLTEHARGEAEHDRLAAAIEQATESIEITDLEGRITYVNPAFERATGYTRDEVVGQNPRILKSGAQSPAFYEAMWSTLTSGRPWSGDLVNRRKDGSTVTEAAVISPIRDAHGAISGYVAGKRDVTQAQSARGPLGHPQPPAGPDREDDPRDPPRGRCRSHRPGHLRAGDQPARPGQGAALPVRARRAGDPHRDGRAG